MRNLIFLSCLFFTGLPVSLAQSSVGKASSPYGPDSLSCVRHLNAYRELFQKNEIAAALPDWRWVFLNCPAASENIFIEGALILDQQIRDEKDSLHRLQWVDTLMLLYDKRIQYFGREGYVLGRKGVELFFREPWRAEEACRMMQRSIALEGGYSRPPIVVNYMNAVVLLGKQRKLDTLQLVKAYESCQTTLSEALKMGKKEKNTINDAFRSVDNAFNTFLGCDVVEQNYGGLVGPDSLNLDLYREALLALEKKKCQGCEFYLKVSKRLFDKDTTPENALRVARYFQRKSMFRLSLPMYLRASRSKDSLIASESYLGMATVYRFQDRAYWGVQNALKSLELNPSNGMPLILIGDCYAISDNECGLTEFEKKAVFWTAVDKYERAATLDPRLRPVAAERIAKYSALFPGQESIASRQLKEGDEYYVECWIKEKTRVRALKASEP